MNEHQLDRERDGFWWIGKIYDYVRSHAYDCTCQVGGVDAMSIDTDWLRHAARTIRHEHRAMAERAELAEARIQAVEALCDAAEDPDQWPPRPVIHGGEPFPASLLVADIRRALEGEA